MRAVFQQNSSHEVTSRALAAPFPRSALARSCLIFPRAPCFLLGRTLFQVPKTRAYTPAGQLSTLTSCLFGHSARSAGIHTSSSIHRPCIELLLLGASEKPSGRFEPCCACGLQYRGLHGLEPLLLPSPLLSSPNPSFPDNSYLPRGCLLQTLPPSATCSLSLSSGVPWSHFRYCRDLAAPLHSWEA